MTWMAQASLILNLLVLTPVCAGLMLSAKWTLPVYGPATPSRGILLSVYLAIWGLSALLILHPAPQMILALLLVQILYKLTTPITVRSLANPVVLSNLVIAAFHMVTVALLWRQGAA